MTVPTHAPGQPTSYEIDLPLNPNGTPLITMNRRHGHPARANRHTQDIRKMVGYRARNQRIPPARFVITQLHYIPPDNKRRDPDNLVSCSKPAVDALVDANIVPGDTPEHVRQIHARIHDKSAYDGTPRMWLQIWHYLTEPPAFPEPPRMRTVYTHPDSTPEHTRELTVHLDERGLWISIEHEHRLGAFLDRQPLADHHFTNTDLRDLVHTLNRYLDQHDQPEGTPAP